MNLSKDTFNLWGLFSPFTCVIAFKSVVVYESHFADS